MENCFDKAYNDKLEAIFTRFPSVQKVPFGDAYKPGLDHMRRFAAILEDPQEKYRTIHVAGTNGKGSVANMLASALASVGLKVGLYTSPHILDFRERMRILSPLALVPKKYVYDFLCLYEKDMDELIHRLRHQNAVIPRSVFSHFVGSDSDDFDNFSAMQFKKFDEGSRKLQSAFSHKILRHMDNSAAIEHFPERQLDMCRLGLGLYGVDPRDNRMLHTVSTLKTTILQLRNVPMDETVGYSRKGVLTRDSVIAAIPIGYADGLNRHLGRGACYCLVNGQKAPYVGNICMDVAMIDVTDIDCKEGDSVEIFGEHLPVTVLSDVLETIPYEVLTGVSGRVKKVYYQD